MALGLLLTGVDIERAEPLVGDHPSVRDQPGVDVNIGDGTSADQRAIAIDDAPDAHHRSVPRITRKRESDLLNAVPSRPLRASAILRSFQRIDPEQANTYATNFYGVSIDHFGDSADLKVLAPDRTRDQEHRAKQHREKPIGLLSQFPAHRQSPSTSMAVNVTCKTTKLGSR